MSPPRTDRRWQLALIFLLALLPTLIAIWCVDYIPTHDGPKNLYAAHVRWHLGEPWFASHFSSSWPVTNFGHALLLGPVERLLPWRGAVRVVVSIVVTTWGLGIFALTRALHPNRVALAVAALAAGMQWAVFMGFMNYVASVGIGLCAMAVGLHTAAWSPKRELAVASLLLVGTAFHPLGPLFAGLALMIARIRDVPSGQRVRSLGAFALSLTPVLGAALVPHFALDEQRLDLMVQGERVVMLPLAQRLENFALCFAGGPAWRAWPLVILALAGLASALLRNARRTRSSAELALIVTCVAATAAALLLPFHGSTWQYYSPRFIPLAALCGLALVPIERMLPRGNSLLLLTAFGFNVASNVWAVHAVRDLRARSAAALAGLGVPCPPGRTLLPIVLDATATGDALRDARSLHPPYELPLLNLGEVYAMDRNAVAPNSFSGLPAIHVVRIQDTFPRVPSADYRGFFASNPAPEQRRGELSRLGTYGAHFDDIIFYGPSADADFLVASGYVPEFRQESLMIGHFKGCPSSLRVEGAPDSGSLIIATGWALYDRPAWALTTPSRSPLTIDLAALSCGNVWVRVIPEKSRARCAGADQDGALAATTPRESEIVCKLEP